MGTCMGMRCMHACVAVPMPVSAAVNVMIYVEVAVGLDKFLCGHTFYYNSTHNCFQLDSTSISVIPNKDQIITTDFYVIGIGTPNVTVRHLWLSDHYPTDLGLYPITSSEPRFVVSYSIPHGHYIIRSVLLAEGSR